TTNMRGPSSPLPSMLCLTIRRFSNCSATSTGARDSGTNRPEACSALSSSIRATVSCFSRSPSVIRSSGSSLPSRLLSIVRSWCEALAARASGDSRAAQAAFLVAREEAAKSVHEQAGYAPGLTVLGLIDAALGRKDDALREGRHAVELLPVTKDSIDGAEVM